jgi:hypothetical protein
MILHEIYQSLPQGYQDLAQDNSQPRLGDLRKTKLTLLQINRLRQLNDVRSIEHTEKLEKIQRQYAPPAQPLV